MDSKTAAMNEQRVHLMRSELLGLVAVLEDRVDLVLAVSLARTTEAVWTLYADVMPRLGWQERMGLLKGVMEETAVPRRRQHLGPATFAQARPLFIPLLQALVEHRHTMAHAVVLPSQGDDTIRLLRRRKGHIDPVNVPVARVQHLMDEQHGLPGRSTSCSPRSGTLRCGACSWASTRKTPRTRSSTRAGKYLAGPRTADVSSRYVA
ncbi:hypothetical protein [Kineococcus rhizosphaerae]|uniref:Uncharacterized protein n=1 Tax=Kineococcus rhizosphaerae TaxID=559628 RepID=A0A2T0QPZ0_9ACTN|nr:hypothetical protein [Kineococcus rhizosphaerae]PRY06787.1 hypothetical protein CLV37_1321 [Kineococcus rhizosphaerae]